MICQNSETETKNQRSKIMPGRTKESRSSIPAHTDAIRIVPLHVPESLLAPAAGIAPAPPPELTYRGGPLLSAAEVFTVFWGAMWQKAPLSDTATGLNRFFAFMLTSPLIDQLAEYSIKQYLISHGNL